MSELLRKWCEEQDRAGMMPEPCGHCGFHGNAWVHAWVRGCCRGGKCGPADCAACSRLRRSDTPPAAVVA